MRFPFFRLECERWQELLHRCFETLIVCRSLFVYSNTTLLELQTLLFLCFSKICASKLGVRLIYGCGLYTDVYGNIKKGRVSFGQPTRPRVYLGLVVSNKCLFIPKFHYCLKMKPTCQQPRWQHSFFAFAVNQFFLQG